MMNKKKTLKNVDIRGKKVIMRVDFNVPLADNKPIIVDNTRIQLAIPSIQYILNKEASLILMSHLGQPNGKFIDSLSLFPMAFELSKLLNKEVQVAKDCIGEQVRKQVQKLKAGDILLLENLRFHKEESKNDPDFAGQLASLADIYVNDAFGVVHRNHASTEGITRHLVSVAGLLMEKELKCLTGIKTKARHPFVAIIGGVKVSTKLPVLHALLDKVDILVIGGAMAYNFLKVQGYGIGDSVFEKEYLDQTKGIIQKALEKNVELVLPIDHQVSNHFGSEGDRKMVFNDIPDGFVGMDIGEKTIALIQEKVQFAKTILWNGPLGVCELESFAMGTFEITKTLAQSQAWTVVGGGDSVSAIQKSGFEKGFDHISSGGGACLSFIAGEKLPALDALNQF